MYLCKDTTWTDLGVASTIVPPGAVVAFSLPACPSGYLFADGGAVSRTAYADLFSAIGASYGSGDGSTTFNLPDYRGQFLRGHAGGSANDPDRASRLNRGDGTTGDNVGTKQSDTNGSHNHGFGTLSGSTDATGSHSHGAGTLGATLTAIADHSHTPGTLAGSTDSEANHVHSVGTIGATTNSTGAHTHTYGVNRASDQATGGTATRVIGVGAEVSTSTTSSGTHSHTATLSGSLGASANHSHSITLSSGSTSSDGTHNHTVTLSGELGPAAGSHSHLASANSGTLDVSGGNENRPTNIYAIFCIKE